MHHHRFRAFASRAVTILTVLPVLSVVACSSDDGGQVLGPEVVTLPDDTIGVPDKPTIPELSVVEQAMVTRVTPSGLEITVPLDVTAGAGQDATVKVRLTNLEGASGPLGTTTLRLESGRQNARVLVPGAALPELQGAQAGWLLRYEVTVGESVASGARSLYVTLPKVGLRMWAPSSMDAGTTTAVRVWVVDLATGALLPDVVVDVAGTKVTTDLAGQAAFEVEAPTTGTMADIQATASVDGVRVALERMITVTPEGAPRVFLSTDKPLYRPGQTIHLRALALAARDLKPLADTPVVLEVLDGKATKVFREETTTSAYGIASLSAPIARQVNLGTYTIRAIIDPTAETPLVAERHVEVSEQALPKFAVTVTFDEPFFEPGSQVTGTVLARYFFGQAAAGAAVTITAASGTAASGTFTGTTDADGVMAFSLPAAAQGSLALSVDVVDTAGFSVSVTGATHVAAAALGLELIPEATAIADEGRWIAYLKTTGPTGGALPATCDVTPDAAEQEPFQVTTEANGLAQIELTDPTGFKALCKAGELTSPQRSLVHPTRAGALVLRTDKAMYRPGEAIGVTVLAPGHEAVFIDRVHRGRIVASQELEVLNGAAIAQLKAGADELGTIVLTAYTFSAEGQSTSAERLVYVQKPAANVAVTTDAPSYLPGAEATLTFSVTDAEGEGQAAAIGVAIADEAVFALAGQVGAEQVVGHFHLADEPAVVHPFALAPNDQVDQLAAQVAVARAGVMSPATASSLSLDRIQSDARAVYAPPLAAVLAAIVADVQPLLDDGTDPDAVAALLAQLQIYDHWGQRLTLTASVQEDWWERRMRINLVSLGLDEIADTWDDHTERVFLPLPWQDADGLNSPSAGAADAATSSADSGGGPWPPTDPSESEGPEAPEPREDFPETLYVNPAVITDETGKAHVTIPVADSITRWRVAMIANTSGGLVGSGTGGITVFQDFFVDADLPRSLTVGDRLDLPLAVFNFSDVAQEVTVTVAAAGWFELLSGGERVVSVDPGASVRVPIGVLVSEAGDHVLEVSAVSATASDAIRKSVSVVPDGQRHDGSLSGPLEGDETVTATYPPDAIEGGNDAVLKIMGGPSGQLLDGVEALLGAPNGCFEPMMNATWVNALVLDYLGWTGSEDKGLIEKARANLADGMQQCATFECTGGGFTWFGDPDPAHPILTAFALILFNDVAPLLPVDPGMTERAVAMLTGQQGSDGGWTTNEHTKNEALPWNELRTTCIVTWGLALTEGVDVARLANAVGFIDAHLDLTADTYTLGMCANALLAAAPAETNTDSVLSELIERAQTDGDRVFWTSDWSGMTHASGEVLTVETTALVTQALFTLTTPPTLVEGSLKYLAGKKSPDGGFLSTQGTIQALRAFVAAARFAAGEVDAEVTVTVGGEVVFTTHIDGDNRDVVHFVALSQHVAAGADTPVTVTMSGEGKLYYQLANRFYIPWAVGRRVGPSMDVTATYDPIEMTTEESTTVTITVTSAVEIEPSDMPMLQYDIPPGFDADLGSLDRKVKEDALLARYERKGDTLLLYLHHLPLDGAAFEVSLTLRPRMAMEVTTPAAKTWPFYRPTELSESDPVVLTVTEP